MRRGKQQGGTGGRRKVEVSHARAHGQKRRQKRRPPRPAERTPRHPRRRAASTALAGARYRKKHTTVPTAGTTVFKMSARVPSAAPGTAPPGSTASDMAAPGPLPMHRSELGGPSKLVMGCGVVSGTAGRGCNEGGRKSASSVLGCPGHANLLALPFLLTGADSARLRGSALPVPPARENTHNSVKQQQQNNE